MVFTPTEPSFLMSPMEMMPAVMENRTMGTTMNLMRFRKMVPKGLT